MTAVIYDGPDFEKWRKEVEMRERCRHSLILQLFGITRSARVNGLIYHDGVLPVEKVRDTHRNSPLASAYLEYTLCRDLNAAAAYWNSQTGVWLYDFDSPDYTAWIRMSTGRLCVDVGATSPTPPLLMAPALDTAVADSLLVTSGAAGFETALLAEMALDDIHTILCYGIVSRSQTPQNNMIVDIIPVWSLIQLAGVIPITGFTGQNPNDHG
ncbi:hypothetical protein B0H11DRAFT_673360 [Mycena galericulata]|nr:hypothetical protein B0H11DRAFT_673360 [Mycena galericulata]